MEKGRKKRIQIALAWAMSLCMLSSIGQKVSYAAEATRSAEAKAEAEYKEELASYADQYPDGVFSFYKSEMDVSEDDGTVTFDVVRMGGTDIADSVEIKSVDVSASYGKDYTVSVKDGDTWKDLDDTECADTLVDQMINGDNDGQTVNATATPESTATAAPQKAKVATSGAMSLRDAKSAQTGVESDQLSWDKAGDLSEEALNKVTTSAENQLIDSYKGAKAVLHFAKGEYKKTVRITLKDDTLAESNEIIMFVLGNAKKIPVGVNAKLAVRIKDNEKTEEMVFSMKKGSMSVDAAKKTAKIIVKRTGGINYYASAVVSTSSDTANAGTDYAALNSAEVTFAAGQKTKAIEVPISSDAKDGSQFKVQLNSGAQKIGETAECIVTIKNELNKKITKTEETSVSDTVKKSLQSSKAKKTVTSRAAGSIVYTTEEKKFDKTYDCADGFSEQSQTEDISSEMTYATKMEVSYTVTGQRDVWHVYKDKKAWLEVGGRQRAYHYIDAERTKDFKESFSVNASDRANGRLKMTGEPQGLNRTCDFKNVVCKFYYPKYNVTIDNSNNKLTGYTYTSSKKEKTEATTYTAGTYSGATSFTLSKGSSHNIAPQITTRGVSVDHYDIYVGNDVIGSTYFSSLYYFTLGDLLKDYQGKLEGANCSVTIKPVYVANDAKVTFKTQDKSCVAYSGDTGSDGFKIDETIDCTQIDKVKIVANSANNQQYKVTKVVRTKVEHKGALFWKKTIKTPVGTYQPESPSTEYTFTIDDLTSEQEVSVYYREPSIKISYDSDQNQLLEGDTNPLLKSAVSLKSLTNAAFEVLNGGVNEAIHATSNVRMTDTYAASYIQGDGGDSNSTDYTYQTVWNYLNKEGKYESVVGDAYVFNPYYADTEIQYFTRPISKREKLYGISGKVMISENLLFTGNKTVKAAPVAAVGAKVTLGGETATVDKDGKYTVPEKFQLGTSVSAFTSYDSLSSSAILNMSKNKVYNPTLNISEDDKLKVNSSTMTKVINKTTTEVEGVSLEDKDYTFTISASGSSQITPGKAEFKFYDKTGVAKPKFTQTVEFKNGQAKLVLNPKAATTTDIDSSTKKPIKQSLAVGDSMTVKLYDTAGNGYYEHHTNVILTEVLSGLYMFNYEGTKEETDSTFVKLCGGISTGYDFVLDALSSDCGQYVNESTGETRQLMAIGFGNAISTPSKTYQLEQETLANLDAAKTGDQTLSSYDDLNILGGGDGGNWGLNLQLGVIMDTKRTDGGKWAFGDFVMIGKAGFSYQREWKFDLKLVDCLITLSFSTGDSSGNMTGVTWHFFPKDRSKEYLVDENGTLDLMTSDKVTSDGEIRLYANINGELYLGKGSSNKSFVGIGGGVIVDTDSRFAYNKSDTETSRSWKNVGYVSVKPSINLKCSIVEIPLYTDTFTYRWNTAKNQSVKSPEELFSEQDVSHNLTKGRTAIARDYLENRDVRSGKQSAFKKASVDTSGGMAETMLTDGLYSESDVCMQKLSDGKYLAVYTDDDTSRETYDKSAVYYRIFNGSTWSEPVQLDNDGTADDVPVICEAGENRYYVAWSSASKKITEDMNTGEMLSTYNIKGTFFDDTSDTFGTVEQITKDTTEDVTADLNPQVTYNKVGDTETLRVYYTKSEYDIADASKGEQVGDVLSPYSAIACREYNFTDSKWDETYTDDKKQSIINASGGRVTEENFNDYQTNWYGQEFIELAPGVDVSETIDEETGFRKEGTDISVSEYTGLNDPVITGMDSIGYNGLSMMAYTLDKDGNTDTSDDQNVYLQIYNEAEKSYSHPILVLNESADISDLQFVRSGDITYLYWIQDGEIRRMNLSNNVKNCLKDGTLGDTSYSYFDRVDSAEGTRNGYFSAEVVASSKTEGTKGTDDTTGEETQKESESKIQSYTVTASDDAIYTIWAEQQVTGSDTEQSVSGSQLKAVKEVVSTHEISQPVQITEVESKYYMASDFGVNDDGTVTGLSTVFDEKDGTMDESSGKLMGLQFNPEMSMDKAMDVDTIEYGKLSKTNDVAVLSANVTLRNNSVNTAKDAVITVKDADGKELFNSAKTTEYTYTETEVPAEDDEDVAGVTLATEMVEKTDQKVDITGGATYEMGFEVPVSESDGSYAYTIQVEDGNETKYSKEIKGTKEEPLVSDGFDAEVVKRNQITVSAGVKNESILKSKAQKLTIGYLDADGEKHELVSKDIASMNQDDSQNMEETLDIDFDKAGIVETASDGSITSQIKLYMATEDEQFVKQYQTIDLSASAEQMDLMNSIDSVSAELTESLAKDETKRITVKVNDKDLLSSDAQDFYGLKTVWMDDEKGVVEVEGENYIKALKEGTTTLKGYIMPVDTEFVGENGMQTAVDNYDILPKEAMREVEVNITVGSANANTTPTPTSTPGTNNISNDSSKVQMSQTKLAKIANQSYTGKKVSPSVEVTYNGKKLVKDTDYTVSYSSNKAIGTAKVIVTGKGSYTGSKSANFKIVPKSPQKAKVAKAKSGKKIKWSSSKGATKYVVYYATKKNGKYKKLLVTKKTFALLKSKKLKKGKNYYFKIRAYSKKKAYVSGFSKVVKARR